MILLLLRIAGRCNRREPGAQAPGFFVCCFFATVCYFCLFGDVSSLILIAVMSVSILLNISANFGFAVCMRLLLASARFSASMRISISGAFS
jgi:hypothetical protein